MANLIDHQERGHGLKSDHWVMPCLLYRAVAVIIMKRYGERQGGLIIATYVVLV